MKESTRHDMILSEQLTTDDKKRLWLRLTRRVQALVDLADLLAVDGHLDEDGEIGQRLIEHNETLWAIADDLVALAQSLASHGEAPSATPKAKSEA